MSDNDNPYAYGSSGTLQGSVSYGGADASAQDMGTPAAQPPMSSQFPMQSQQHVGVGEIIKDTSTQEFAVDVMERSQHVPVIVEFWAPWCGPCKQLMPILEKVVQEAGGAVVMVKMDIDKYPEVAGQLGVQSVPAVVAFVGGQPADGFMGAQPESQVKEFVKKLAASSPEAQANEQIEQVLAAGEQALQDGEFDQAAQAFSMVLQHQQGNPRAVAGIVDCMIGTGKAEQAAGLIEQLPDDAKSDPIISGAQKRVEMALEVAKLGDPKALEARIEADDQDFEAKAELAKIKNAMGERDGAVDLLVAIMKADREWEDDGARKMLLDFFEAWGAADPSSISGRRKLSSLLFS